MTAGDAGLQVLGRLEMSASPSAAFGVECPARHSAFSMDFIFHFREPARAAPAMCIAGGDCCREHLPHLPVPPLLAAWRPRISSGARLLSRRICASASPTFGLFALSRCPLWAAVGCFSHCTPLQPSCMAAKPDRSQPPELVWKPTAADASPRQPAKCCSFLGVRRAHCCLGHRDAACPATD